MLESLKRLVGGVAAGLFVLLWTTAAHAVAPNFTKEFSPNNIGPGSVSRLTFTIDNTANLTPTTSLSFTDNLPAIPANMVVKSPPNVATTCTGGTITAVAGSNSISYTNGAVAGASICTISVDVTAPTAGTYSNVSGDLTSSEGNSGTATDDLTVSNAIPGFSKSFSPSTVSLGGVSTLTFTIDNTLNAANAFSLAFTDNLPPVILVASPANSSSTCSNPGITAPAGGNSITFSPPFAGANSVGAGPTCTVSVDV